MRLPAQFSKTRFVITVTCTHGYLYLGVQTFGIT